MLQFPRLGSKFVVTLFNLYFQDVTKELIIYLLFEKLICQLVKPIKPNLPFVIKTFLFVYYRTHFSCHQGSMMFRLSVVLKFLIASSIMINVLLTSLPKLVITYLPYTMSTIPSVSSFYILLLSSLLLIFSTLIKNDGVRTRVVSFLSNAITFKRVNCSSLENSLRTDSNLIG